MEVVEVIEILIGSSLSQISSANSEALKFDPEVYLSSWEHDVGQI